MLSGDGGRDGHEKFREFCALAHSGSLTPLELSELRLHLQRCEECRGILREYRVLTTQGMPTLAATYPEGAEQSAWDDGPTRQRLLARVRAAQRKDPTHNGSTPPSVQASS